MGTVASVQREVGPVSDYPDCPECGQPVTGLAYFGPDNPPGPIAQAIPCYHRIWVATWTVAGS